MSTILDDIKTIATAVSNDAKVVLAKFLKKKTA